MPTTVGGTGYTSCHSNVPLATTHTNTKRESKDDVARSFTLRALGRVIPAALFDL